MKICVTCRVEMTCEKNGVFFVWNEHAYAGDVYKCPNCGNQTAVTGGSFHLPKDTQARCNQELIVKMRSSDAEE